MPIVRQWGVFEDCRLLLWQIAENTDELREGLTVNDDEWDEYRTISHPQKQLEWLTGRRAMQTLIESTGRSYEGMVKDEHGKPHLKNRAAEISLTHTARYIAVALHPTRPIGVDLERIAEKLGRVAPKFLSPEEQRHAADNLHRLCTYWCAKEAIYKLHGTRQLSFKEDIFIQEFGDPDTLLSGCIRSHYTAPDQQFRLHRFGIEDFSGVMAV